MTVQLQPEHTLAVGEGGYDIHLAAVGDEVWATGHRAIVRINAQTNEVTTVETPVAGGSGDSFGAAGGAVWLGDFEQGLMYRLDPTTGAVLSELSVSRPVGFAEANGAIWVGSEASHTMVSIDPSGAEASVTDIPRGHVAGGSVWSSPSPGRVTRFDIVTGEASSIEVSEPAGPGTCFVDGSSPDSVWVLCGDNDTAARLDPDTNSVMATVEVGSPVFGGVHTVAHWAFFLLGTDQAAGIGEDRIVRVDLNTNEVDRIFELGPEFSPNIALVAGDALWVPMEASGELWRLPLADLLEE